MTGSRDNHAAVGIGRVEVRSGKRARIRAARAMLLAVIALAAFASSANAKPSLEGVGTSLTNSAGEFVRAAGAHPDLKFKFAVPTKSVVEGGTAYENVTSSLRDVGLELPAGMVGNSAAFPTCTVTQLLNRDSQANCPIQSQIGTVKVETSGLSPQSAYVALFNLSHGPESPARFGFQYLGVFAFITAQVRSDDYGITSGSAYIPQIQPIRSVEVDVWGVPSDPAHNNERQLPGLPVIIPLGLESQAPLVPFLRTPTSCDEAGSPFGVSADSWNEPGNLFVEAIPSDEDGTPYTFEGCDNLSFDPTLTAQPTSTEAAAPTGLMVGLKVPQSETPNGLSSADVRKAVVTLPAGMAVSPSSASGLGACSESEVAIGREAEPTCPESSKIGTVQVKTQLLDEELEGGLYLAKQRENPFGSLLALYMVVKGPGFYLKLPGKITADAQTGQLTVSFSETPQLPFEELKLNLKTGPRAPLELPNACGTYAVKTEITPWSGTAPVLGESKFTVSQGCTSGGFTPKFKAGTINPTAGSFSPFTLQVTRNDGESNLSGIDATLPPGLLAKLAGVPLCGDALAGSGNCPAASQVGTTTIGAGPGSNPLYVPEVGKAPTAVYLAGPYKGAPYSLVVKVPAQAGPFDLGTVVVRNALKIDPTTTQVTAESDPLPQILEGIPVSYRDVRVEINKPEFTVNPTNCSQFQVTSLLTSSSGQTASPKAPFAAANCERLGFKPTLALQMKGQTKRAGNPALTATLKAPPGQANIANTTVILPKTVFIDQRHVSNPCTRVQFNANACPAKSVLGTAVAYSPLLDKPLEGPVYFRSNGGERQLPDLVADLNGQIHVVLVGFIDSKKVGKETSLVRTRFASVPDAPVSKFVLKLNGGKRSLIQNSANLCKVQPKAEVKMTGQNGKTNDFEQKIAVSCRKAKKSKKAKH